jgi:hypothetical protein
MTMSHDRGQRFNASEIGRSLGAAGNFRAVHVVLGLNFSSSGWGECTFLPAASGRTQARSGLSVPDVARAGERNIGSMPFPLQVP